MSSMKELVTPSLVHKTEIDDVLIYCSETVLINIIKENDFNNLISQNLAHENLLKSVYKKWEQENVCIYIIRTLPLKMPKSLTNTLFFDIDLSNFYKPIDEDNLGLITCYMPLHVEEIIRNRLLPNIAPINSSDKEIIASLQNTAPVHSYFLFNNIENKYFYKKKHEHIPGMMLIEAARQAVYDYVYSLSGYRFKDVSISMSQLEVNFFNYTVSAYPVELLFSQKDYIRRYKPKTLQKKAWLYQRGKFMGTFILTGNVIPMIIFPRLRNQNYPKQHQFYPFNKDTYLRILHSSGKILSKRIIYLTLEGIAIDYNDPDGSEITSVTLMDECNFPIKKYEMENINHNLCYLIFDNLSKVQLLTLNNIINTYYYHQAMFKALNMR
ncbi:MAG: hypothetical protein J6562_03795 [Candidatus Schmidhempelia sp.]|nr:hypothetical protein [Candidatus Schmidhempelia sp.]